MSGGRSGERGSAAESRIYLGRDPREIPAYTMDEAARYLRLPVRSLRKWTSGRRLQSGHRSPPVIPLSEPGVLSFWDLAEAYILSGIRRYHGVPLQHVKAAVDYVRRDRGVRRPLLEESFATDGADLFVERIERGRPLLVIASLSGQLGMRQMLAQTLKRVGRDERGVVARIYPWSHSPKDPLDVEIDPRRAFGRMVVSGTRVPTEMLAERFRAGDTIEHLASDYRLERSVVENALRWEIRDSPKAAA